MWKPDGELKRFRELGLTEDEQEKILHRNAENVFGIPPLKADGDA